MADTTFHSLTLPGLEPARVPSVAAEFTTNTVYAVRDYCTYQGVLYKCIVAHTGAWNASHFQATDLDNEFDDKLKVPPYQSSAPVNPRVGDLWIDEDENSPLLSVDPIPTTGSTNVAQSGGTRTLIDAIDIQKANRYLLTGDYSTSATYEKGQLVFWYPETFDTSHSYIIGESCAHNGIIYTCKIAHEGTWNASHFEAQYNASTDTLYRCIEDIKNPEQWTLSHWQATNINTELNRLRESEADTDMIGDLFGTKTTYAVGDYCIYNDNLYRCIQAVDNTGATTPAFDPEDWTQVALANDVSDLNSAFTDSDYILIGKENLINGVTWEDNKYINSHGEVASATNYRLSGKILVDPRQTYTIIWTNTTGYYRVGAFTSDDLPNGLLINGSNGTRRLLVVTIPANTAYVRFSGYNNSITHGFIKGVSVESNLTSLNNAANVVINAINGIKFDTSNKTITFVKPLYLTIGTQRYNYESTDTVLSYNSVSGSDVCVIYTNNALSCIARSAFNASTMVMIFGFNKNTINNPSTNNIFYPYYVNGTLYNPPTQKRNAVYVDGINGLDTNDGTADYPYKTIQKGINESPSIVYIKRGSYTETIDVNGKTDIQIVPWGTPAFSTDAFDVPMIVVNRVLCRNSQNVYFRDVHANNPGDGNGAWVIIDVINGVFCHCWASNGEGGGFVAKRLDGKFILCKAWNIGSSTYYNSDGFNLHDYGTTELIDCVAHDCYDDGISHHDGCIASIKGGEFWNCTGGGGIAPVNRYCEIDGVYCHDNKYGIESVQTDASLYDPYILIKNSVLKNNTAKDISVGAIPFKVLRCTFDTKQIASGADYVEID